MFQECLRVVTLFLVALAMIPAVAHALELPGKMRLGKDNYFAVQRIYYPGSTLAGMAEPLSFLSTAALLFLMLEGTVVFWLTLLALFCLLGRQAVYWIFVHPINKVWVEGQPMMLEAPSKEEVIKWAQKCPAEEGDIIEVREIFDFETK